MNKILKSQIHSKEYYTAEGSEVLISKTVDFNIPTIIIDFDLFNLEDIDYKKKANSIIENFKYFDMVYTTSKDNMPLTRLKIYNKLTDWTINDGKCFLRDLADLSHRIKNIQLCGIFRELCIVEVARIIKASALNIEPIIIDNDDYSISALYSVRSGDTLENRLSEEGLKPKHINL